MPPFLPAARLAPAHVPQARNSFIGAHAAQDLQVHIEPWPQRQDHDQVAVFWNGTFVDARPAALAGHEAFSIPPWLIGNGVAHVRYQVLRVGQRPWCSPNLRLWVKLKCPGGGQLGDDINPSLAPLGLAARLLDQPVRLHALGAGLAFSLAPWRHMAADDAATLRWGDRRLDLPAVTAKQVGRALRGLIPASLIHEAGPHGYTEVSYCIIDRAGNHSGWAHGRCIDVRP